MTKDQKQRERWLPYFKPTMRKHDSGYRIFEIGYISEDEKMNALIEEAFED